MLLTAAKLIGAELASISLAGVDIGIGTIFGFFQIVLDHNPRLMNVPFHYAILSVALTETIAFAETIALMETIVLFGLMMALLILFIVLQKLDYTDFTITHSGKKFVSPSKSITDFNLLNHLRSKLLFTVVGTSDHKLMDRLYSLSGFFSAIVGTIFSIIIHFN